MAAPPEAVDFTFPPTATRGQDATFQATATDPDEGDTISYSWTFGDGTPAATGATVTHDYAGSSAGAKTVTLTATDSNGESADPVTHTVTVLNAPPVAHIVHTAVSAEPAGPCGGGGQDPAIPMIGQQVAFSGTTSTDPDNSVDAAPGQVIKTYAWDLDNDGQFGAGDSESTLSGATATFATAGNKTVGLRVTDSDDAPDDETDTFRVNTPPVPGFITDDPTPVTNQQITFASTSDDPDWRVPGVNEELSYAWDFDGDGFDDGTGQNTTHAFSTPGTKTVRLCVRDTGGIARMFTNDVFVQTTVPTGDFTFSPGSPLPGEPVMFTSTSTPTSGKQLTAWEWDFDYDGATFTADASGASVSHAFPTAGSKNVALRVFEAEPGGGGQGYDVVAHTVSVNAPPQAGFTVSPATGIVGRTVTLASTSADPDGPLVRQDWDLDNDGQYDDANAAVVSATFTRARTYAVKLRVTDSRGATDTETKSIVVKRAPLTVLPNVDFEFSLLRAGRVMKITRLRVHAPRGSKVRVRCVGRHCSKHAVTRRKGRKLLSFKRFQRRVFPGTRIVVSVTKPGYIGKQRTYRIRRAGFTKRTRCLVPGVKKPIRCPRG